MKYYSKHIFQLSTALIILILLVLPLSAECDVWVKSCLDLPVEHAEVYFRNITTDDLFYNTTTDATGYATYTGGCGNASITIIYPSSAYSASLSSVSASDVYYINDYVSASVQLTNTLGSYLEGQDCSVVVYEVNTSHLIHDYNTLCYVGESFVDANGNLVSTSDCKLTDSSGFYHFKGRTDESLGYVYGESYDIVMVCNSKNATHTFRLDLDKPYDIGKVEHFSQRYGGLIVLAILMGAGILVVVSFVVWFIYQSKKTA